MKRRVRAFLALGALVALFFSAADVARAEGRKLALVIGNDNYEQQPSLEKAIGDAHAMRAALEKLGFEVRLAQDLDYAEMVDTLANFQSSIEPGDTVAFHFSGHGVAANGRNYLLPVDFPQPTSARQGEVTLPRLAFDAGEIVDGLKGQGAALTLAVLDACRNNALTSGTRAVGLSRGLVRMDPPRGVFIMFSAGPGELAADRLSDDDAAATSVFTRVFIPILETPGLTLVEVAKRTQVKVSELAATVDHQQFPDYSDRVIGDVVLLPKAEPETPIAPPAATETEIATVAPTTTVPPSTPPSSSEAVSPPTVPADADVVLCDSIAGDPFDPLLPASVDRSRLYDLERIVDHAVADREAGKSRPDYEKLVLEGMPGAAVACEAAVKKRPEEKRFVYQQTRAMCLSGMSEYCPEAIKGLDSLDYAPATKFAAFAGLAAVEDEQAAGGLSSLLDDARADEWFGLPRGDVSGALEDVQRIQEYLKTASAAGDREASSLLLLFEEPDRDRRIARLQDAGANGNPIGLAAVATLVNIGPGSLTLPMRVLLGTAVANGSDLARILLIFEDRNQDKTPAVLQKAKDILTPEVIARSPTAAMVLKQIETDVLAAVSPEAGNDAGTATPEVSPPPVEVETSTPVDPGDEKYKALAGREIWISASPAGKEMAARVEERLRSVGMSVTVFDGDPQYGWDHDLDYGPSSNETAPLVQELLSDIYPMDLVFAETRDVPNVTITPSAEASVAPEPTTRAAGDTSGDKYQSLSGRDVWVTVNPKGKEEAALVEERLRAAGMNVMIDEVDEQYDWDHDLDYGPQDAEIALLLQDLVSDLYQTDLLVAENRTIPNIQITPRE